MATMVNGKQISWWMLALGRDIFRLENFDAFKVTSVRVSKMSAVARAQLTLQILTLLRQYG